MTTLESLATFSEAPAARRPVDIEMDAAESLIPVSQYTSRAFYDDEVSGLWTRVWQIACRVEELPKPGAYLEYAVADQSFLVVRGEDGKLRAFHNVCRHRGNLLKCGAGVARDIRCGFHQWTWSLDGTLKNIPDAEAFRAVDTSQYRLFEAAVDTWAGFVFINPSPEAAAKLSLAEFLEPVTEHLDPYHFEEMVSFSNMTTPLAANWKVTVEAFLEAYHVQGVHPQLLPSNDDLNTCYEVFDTHSRMLTRFAIASPRLGPDVEALETIAYLPNALGGPTSTGVTMSYDTSSMRKVVDELANDAGEIVLPPGSDVSDLIAKLIVPFVDAEGRLVPGASTREVLVEMIAAFVVDGDTLRLPTGTTARDLYINMVRAVATAKGHDYSGLTWGQTIDDWHYFLFPNVILNIQAGAFLFVRVRPDGQDHERCFFDVGRFVWPTEPTLPAPHQDVDTATTSFGPVLDQDVENIPRVQKGLHSRALSNITVGSHETRIVHFHKMIDRYISGEALA
jgi:phenylpropionate dioxygenase-like ring-hydroxylating dioxygenase large terminal subunit